MYPAYPPPSDRAVELEALLTRFLAEHVFPAEAAYDEYARRPGPTTPRCRRSSRT